MTRRSSRRSSSDDGGSRKSAFVRGSAGRDRYADEVEKQKERANRSNDPFRFFMKPGETKEYIILDDAPDFFMYEHNLKDPRTGKWSKRSGCIKDFDNCPVCEEVSESAYVMFLSVLDLTPYESDKHGTIEFTRKLLPVKMAQQKKFLRKYEKDGTLRGLVVEANRDGPKDAAIGNDIEFVDKVSEDELMEDYWREWEDKDGKAHEENCGEPFVYEDIFEEPTRKQLLAVMGKGVDEDEGGRGRGKTKRRGRRGDSDHTPGSKAHDEEMLDDEDQDDAPWDGDKEEGDEKPRRGRSSRRGRGGDDEEEEKPSRSRRSRRGKDDDEEEKPRRSKRSSRNDDDEEEEESPRRGRSSRRRR